MRELGKKQVAFLVVVCILSMSFFGNGLTLFAANLIVYDAKVEYMESPIGIEREHPSFSWKVKKGSERDVKQQKYTIRVAKTKEDLENGTNLLWETTEVTDKSNGIEYAGSVLESGMEYVWNVEVEDTTENKITSEPATFGMGLLTEDKWSGAQWISNVGGTGSENKQDGRKYSIECDFTVEYGSLGLIFGNPDTNTFYMWQLNSDEDKTNNHLTFRPHKWTNNSPKVMGEYDIETVMSKQEFLGKEHTFKVEVDNGQIKAYLDEKPLVYDKPLNTTESSTKSYLEDSEMIERGAVGIRAFKGQNDADKLKINRLVLKDSEGKPVYFDDFLGFNSLDFGVVEDGEVSIDPTDGEKRIWPNKTDTKTYSVQTDVQINSAAAGLVFGQTETNHFYMWQLNTFDYKPNTYLRPHIWNPGGQCIDNVNINDILPKGKIEGEMNQFRIDVNDGMITSYINQIKIDERQDARLPDIGRIGIRQAWDQASKTNEKATYDNMMLRDNGGNVICYEDFETDNNPFGSGEIKDGKLTIEKESNKEFFLWNETVEEGTSKVPLLSKDFETEDKEIKRAVVYASALGHYEMQLNGEKVGDDYMAPGWTEYKSRVQYQAYDVTAQLKKNETNRIGAMLAPGWYSGNISILGNNRYGNTQALISTMLIEYADGTTQEVITDESWNYSMDGPIIETDMFDGETYDATKELGEGKYGWTDPSFNKEGWNQVGVIFDSAYKVKTGASGGKPIQLSAQIGQTVKKIQDVEPVSITEDVNGKYVVDMGQNFAGILNMTLTGKAGETATIRYGEMLNDDSGTGDGKEGTIYTANLRSAKVTDRYTFKSNENETWEPNFTFHGFRYVEISGVSKKPAIGDIKGIALASAMEETGTFNSSNELLNQIYNNTFWGQRSNFLSIPTDCPQRDERMGWGADTLVFAKTGMLNMDAMMFYQKWLTDVRDGQDANGSYGNVAPNPHGFMNDVVWSSGGVVVPYILWQMTGDNRVLTDGYDSMTSYMDFRATQGNLQSCGYGDWLEPIDGSSNKEVVGTTYYAYQLAIMEEIATALGKTEEASAYKAQFDAVKETFTKKHISADGTVTGGLQSAYVLTLGSGLANEANEELLVENLVKQIEKDGNLMSVGFVSVNMLMPVLTKYGHSEVAYQLAMNTDYPSWGYSIEQGATTIWERWNSYTKESGFGPVSMNSFNHYSFGSVCEWFYTGIGGINTDKENPGYENIIIEPTLDSRLTFAETSYETVRGNVKTKWEIKGTNKVELEVTVPGNATATIVFPETASDIKEGNVIKKKISSDLDGFGAITKAEESSKTEVEVGSGTYKFSFGWQGKIIRTELKSEIKKAEKKIEIIEDYSEKSIDLVAKEIKKAKEIDANSESTQSEIDKVVASLKEIVSKLEKSGNVNLALKKTAKASSSVNATGSFAPDKLVDGTRRGGGETTWSSGNNVNQNHLEWIEVDLGETTDFNRFLIFPRDDGAPSGYGFPKDFTLEVSTDKESWEKVVIRSNYPFVGTSPQRFTIPTANARYIRMNMSSLNANPNDQNSYRAQLAEFEVYNLEQATIGKEELKALIKEAEKENEANYTEETWTLFSKALTTGKSIVEKEDATDKEIKDAYKELKTTWEGLKRPEVSTGANWVWSAESTGTTLPNEWMAFRKTVELDGVSGNSVMAKIAADSKYWLYINDQLVVFEGSLKRGPNPKDTYVDNVDIGSYLKNGTNTISLLALHYGKDGYSHSSSGRGGLFFEAKVGETDISSNETWKAKKLEEYGTSAKPLNYRLSESNLKYDARMETKDWFKTDFNDSAWGQATAYGGEGAAPWNAFVDRPIPMFAFDDYKLFAENEITTSKEVVPTSDFEIGESEYVIESKFQMNAKAFGIVFGRKDDGNLNMWQINGDGRNVPILKPHIKASNNWTTPGSQPEIASITGAEIFTHEYVMKLVVKDKKVSTYVDGVLIDERTVGNTSGSIGFRADHTEKGTVDYIKVTSLDGNTVYMEDAFEGTLGFSGGKIEDNKLVWQGVGGIDLNVKVNVENVTRYECKLPTNIQFTPYLDVVGTGGEVINIYTDKTNVKDGPALQAEYVTKNGPQSYESLIWINGDKLYFEIPDSVTVKELGYRKSGYDAEFSGSFTSDDAFLNTLWEKSRDTLYVTMRDNFMDCPDREKAQWWGDAVNEMQMAFYSLSPDARLLAKKGIGNVIGYASEEGALPTVAPSGSRFQELPVQSLAGVMSFYMYYEYTGEIEVIKETYMPSYKYLKLFKMDKDGLVEHRTGSWDWSDWGSGSDQRLITNAWYYIALDRTVKMAEAIGEDSNSEEVVELKRRMKSIEDNFEGIFWNEEGFYRSPSTTVTDDRGNALAVYAGLVPEEKYSQVRDILTTVKQASPYMEKYVLEALYMMGYEEEALARTKERYATMVSSELTTLWEFWDPESGTTNHAWTGGPLTLMGMYTAGVSPIEPGYSKFKVAPQLGSVKTVNTIIPSVKGDIGVTINAENTDGLVLGVEIPSGTTGVIGVPLIGGARATAITHNGITIWENGEAVVDAAIASIGSDQKFAYFESTESITLTAKRGEVQTLRIDNDDRENMKLFVNQVEKTMPYKELFRKGDEVAIKFVPKYEEEYGVLRIEGIELEDETQYEYALTLQEDYTLMAHVAYIGEKNLAKEQKVEATNAMDANSTAWGVKNLVDGTRTSTDGKSGFTTKEYTDSDIKTEPQEIILDLGKIQLLEKVYLYPRTNAKTKDGKHPCYPKDFTIAVSEDGTTYKEVANLTDEVVSQGRRGEYEFQGVSGQFVKIITTKLGTPAAEEQERFRLQLAEIEVYGNEWTAQDVANGIQSLVAPEKDQTNMPNLKLPKGFEGSIKTSSNKEIIALDGQIKLPEKDTTVTLEYEITRTADEDKGITKTLPVIIPGMTPIALQIKTQPKSISVTSGETGTFELEVTGSYPHFQWQQLEGSNWTDIEGAIETSFQTDSVSSVDSGNKFRCKIKNGAGEVKSDAATLVVINAGEEKALTIKTTPEGKTISYGQTLSSSTIIKGIVENQEGTVVEGTYKWKNEAISPAAGITRNMVIFTPEDTQYSSITFGLVIVVEKAIPSITGIVAAEVLFGQKLEHSNVSAETITNIHNEEVVSGSVSWSDNQIKPKNGETHNLVFVPEDTENYKTLEVQTVVKVNPSTPKLIVTLDEKKAMPGKELKVQVKVENAYDNALTEGLPVPMIQGVPLPKEGDHYTGKVIIPAESIVGNEVIVEIKTPEVEGIYSASKNEMFVKVVPEIIKVKEGVYETNLTLPPCTEAKVKESVTETTVEIPSFPISLAKTDILNLKLKADMDSIVSVIEEATTKTVVINMILPTAFAKDKRVEIQTLPLGKQVLEAAALKGKEVHIRIVDESKVLLYSWDFGKIESNKVESDIDLAVSLKAINENKTIANLINDEKAVIVSFAHSGALPKATKVTLGMQEYQIKENAKLFLYYFNEQTKKLALEGTPTVDKDKYVALSITHCSDYVLTTKEVKGSAIEPTKPGDKEVRPGGAGSNKNNVKTGDVTQVGILFVMALGSIIVLYRRRERKS